MSYLFAILTGRIGVRSRIVCGAQFLCNSSGQTHTSACKWMCVRVQKVTNEQHVRICIRTSTTRALP